MKSSQSVYSVRVHEKKSW